jgi:hypothetical protein
MASGPVPRTAGWAVVGSVGPYCGLIGPQGSGKTLDLLIPALLSASGLRW